ncbi:hypothetical protein [Herbaspirillum chlorophenolicum]|uniref:hypothetical protein n=1 Tax=Herbaspirillum chlorophenolicum TaxID=211589 RepID=UPI0012E2A520|nr:hypothetical protein [Herbaspirillum chlorophenolicum]
MLKTTFLLVLVSIIGGFISAVLSSTLIHRLGLPLEKWLPGSSLLFLPAYFLSAGLIALTLFKLRSRISIKLALVPALAAEIAGPYCGLILAIPFVCFIASDCF